MKRTIPLLLALLLLSLALPAVSAASTDSWGGSYAGSNTDGVLYCDGLLDENTATLTALDSSNRLGLPAASLQVAPNVSGASDAPIVLRHTSAPRLSVPLADARYIRISYRYSGKTFRGRPRLEFSAREHHLSKDCTVYAMDTITANKTSGVYYLFFDITEVLHGFTYPGGRVPAFDFYPFGDTPVSSLKSTDLLYVTRIDYLGADSSIVKTSVQNGTLVQRYPVYFVSGSADCTGSMEPDMRKFDETFTLPENGFSRPGYTFHGWRCIAGGTLYAPGSSYTMVSRSINKYDTASITFVADWMKGDSTLLPDSLGLDYGSYCSGIVDKKATATVDKNSSYDGYKAVRVVPNTAFTGNTAVDLDYWTWQYVPFDISVFKYVSFVYYYKTNRASVSFIPQLRLLRGTTKALKTTVCFNAASRALKTNAWAVMTFDISAAMEQLDESANSTIVNQTHFYPFGQSAYPRTLTQGDEIYIARVIFQKTKPDEDPYVAEGYFTGYSDGTFRPNALLTRAEAASALSRATAQRSALDAAAQQTQTSFTDVPANAWYRPYVAYLEGKGVLASGGAFRPNDPITGDELAAWIVRCRLGTGADAATRYAGKTLSRAEAVVLIDLLQKDGAASEAMSLPVDLYSDVDSSVWCYPEIASAALTRVCCVKDGAIVDIDYMQTEVETEPVGYDLDAGAAYLRELDVETARRIAAIRATPNTVDPSTVTTGTVYYLSTTSGSAASAGTSPSSPRRITTLSAVNTKVGNADIKAGDVLLFKRGDTFRGQLTTVAGVTYSAFGTGAKPVFIRNTEEDAHNQYLWTLDYQDKKTGAKIWKYSNEDLVDVGAIMLIDKDGKTTVARKEIPSYFDGAFWVRGQTNTTEYDYKTELDRDLEYVQFDPPTGTSGHRGSTTGPLYLRCDAGNPGTLYTRIEFNLYGNCIRAVSGVTVDNLCILYFGSHGIGAGTVDNLIVTNCEIGWGGGAIQYYNMDSNGSVVRYGNGVEIYGGLHNYTIDNCYVYQIYDAGITHQISSTSNGNYLMDTVTYTNNVLEDSTYNIEYFMSKNDDGEDSVRFMNNILIADNIIRRAGYGWGRQRPSSQPSGIKGWTHYNFANNYVVRGNIIDRCYNEEGGYDYLCQFGCSYETSAPLLLDNVFVQVPGRDLVSVVGTLYEYGTPDRVALILDSLDWRDNTWYYVAEDNGVS